MFKNPDSLRRHSIRAVFKSGRNYKDHEVMKNSNEKFLANDLEILTLRQMEDIRIQLHDRDVEYSTLLNDANYADGDDVIQHLLAYPKHGLYYGALYKSFVLFEISKTSLETMNIDRDDMIKIYKDALLLSIASGDISMFDICLDCFQKYYTNVDDVDDVLYMMCPTAARLNHMKLLRYFVHNDIGDARMMLLRGAALNKISVEPFKYLLKVLRRDDDDIVITLNKALLGDSVSDDIMNLLIEEGANDYDAGLILCARMKSFRSIEFAKYFVQNGANSFSTALETAIISFNEAFIKMLTEMIDKNEIDYTRDNFTATLNHVLKGNSVVSDNSMELLIKYGAYDYDAGLMHCVKMTSPKSVDFAEYFIIKGARNLREALINAVYHLNINVLKSLLKRGYRYSNAALKALIMKHTITYVHTKKLKKVLRILLLNGADINEGMKIAIDNSDVYIVSMLSNLGVPNFDINEAILNAAISQTSDMDILQILLESDANNTFGDIDFVRSSLHEHIDGLNSYIEELRGSNDDEDHNEQVFNDTSGTSIESILNLRKQIISKNDIIAARLLHKK